MLINYTGPAIVVALSPLLLKERITPAKTAALASALLGAFFISGQAAASGINLWGLVNTGIGCYCYFSSIGGLPAQSVAICGYLEPLSAVLLSVLILHETMAPLQILGAVLIIGGAVFGECCKV